jgi:tellurite resistance protein
MKEARDYLEMSFRSIQCFTDDGKLDASELGKILEIAERDGKIDNNEIRVLQNIIERIKPQEIDEAMRKKLKEISEKIG